MKRTFLLLIALLLLLAAGCAFNVIRVEQTPTKLASDNFCNNSFVLAKNIDIQPSGGYSRTLKKGTKWNCVGRVTQGEVYKTNDQILTLEGSNIFEAYIVVSSKKLVGFYLPVEHTFSQLDYPIELSMNESTQVQSTNQ